MLVAKATSDGADLDLVLYPGRGSGAQTLGFSRLAPGARYAVDGPATPAEFELTDRTALRVVPRG